MKRLNRIGILGLLGFALLNWSQSVAFALTIGVTAGPHAVILEQVKAQLSKAGISLKIIEFNDFILPNAALDAGDLDLNSYQHQPFLDDQVKTRGYHLVSIAKTILLPLGAYSKKIKTLDQLPVRAKVAIPNDPTNGGRALLLLKKAGLIELKNLVNPSLLDITQNKKNLQIIEMEAPQLPRVLPEVDLALINTDWILVAGLDPSEALFRESTDSPYANILVTKKGQEQRADIKAFLEAYRSKATREFIQTQFKGAILPAW